MSKIIARDDLRDNVWDIIEENIQGNYADLFIGFSDEEPVVKFESLSFGFTLSHNGETIDSQQWPPEGVHYRRTDQEYIVAHRLKFQPETEYVLYMWAENAGIRAERSHTFTTPRPAQPYASWIWDGTQWNAPVPYPGDGGEYEWNELSGEWTVFEGDPE